jgi:guanylate kinase
MLPTSPSSARANAKRSAKMQPGVVVSYTVVRHPPAGFGHAPRTIALVQLEDGSRVLAPLLSPNPAIGMHVAPRMRLTAVTEQKLRLYDVAYEETVPVDSPLQEEEFPGYILALTGPSGVGKSTVSKMLFSLCGDLARPVPILTTRERRDGDDGEYRYVSKKVFTDLQKNGKLAAWTHIPSESEDRWYGYKEEDIRAIWADGKLPMVITEMHLLQGLASRFGRRSILSCGLLPPGKSTRTRLSALLHRLRERGRETELHLKSRLKNAKEDLEFFTRRRDLFDFLFVNDDLQTVITAIRKSVPGLAEAKN